MSLKSKIDQVKALGVANSALILKNKLSRNFRNNKQRKLDFSVATYKTYDKALNFKFNFLPDYPLDWLIIRKNDILQFADYSANHRFDILGSGLTNVYHGCSTKGFENSVYDKKLVITLSNKAQSLINDSNAVISKSYFRLIDSDYVPIDWQLDLRSGYRWSEQTWYKDIRYGYDTGADIKVPWELGRLQHLIYFAYAYFIHVSNDDVASANQIIAEYRNQIIDFVASNPPRFGCQWTTAMDVSIRLVSLLTSMNLFISFGAQFDTDFIELFRNSLIEHILHIRSNLEISGNMRGNHYLANIAGLCFAAAYLDKSDLKTELLDFCKKELSNEILFQFNPDGSNFEASTKYHLFAFEMLVYSLFALSKEKDCLEQILTNSNLKSRLNSIIEFSESIIIGNASPSIGDVDSGFFLRFTPFFTKKCTDDKEFCYIDTECVYNLNSLIKGIRGDSHNETDYEFIIGKELSRFITLDKKSYLDNYTFNDFGSAKASNAKFDLFLFAGPVGQNGKGGHAHNDKLSFEMFVDKRPFIVDPGTYCYTSNWDLRNKYRSVLAHNTLIVDKIEQNKFNESTKDDLFWIAEINAKSSILQNENNQIIAQCEYSDISHKREIKITANEVLGTDHCDTSREKEYLFHFAPGINLEETQAGILISSQSYKCLFTSDCEKTIISDYDYSPHYGIKEKSKKITALTSKSVHNWKFSFILE